MSEFSFSKEDEERIWGPPPAFAIGHRVKKVRGSSWHGRVVGYYTTALTPQGYVVESEREPGSVQLYPAAALEAMIETPDDNDAALGIARSWVSGPGRVHGLATDIEKYLATLKEENARLLDVAQKEPHAAYLEAVQRACDERVVALKHAERAALTRAEAAERQLAEALAGIEKLRTYGEQGGTAAEIKAVREWATIVNQEG